MATHDHLKFHGRTARFEPVPGIYFNVRIVDTKMSYGRLRFLIQPLAGAGEKWVEHTSICLWES